MPITNPETLKGQTVTGSDGGKLGKIDDAYLDTQTGRPEWAAVKTGTDLTTAHDDTEHASRADHSDPTP